MPADPLRSFRFATDAQWNTCLFAETDGDVLRSTGIVQPFPAYERTAAVFDSPGARAPVVTRSGEIIWVDADGNLYRLSQCDDAPTVVPAPPAMAAAGRIVATGDALWVSASGPDVLQRFEADTLARILTVDLPAQRVIDIAGDGRGSVFALVERDGTYYVVLVDCAGHAHDPIEMTGLCDAPHAFVYLAASKRFAILAGTVHQRLYWFSSDGRLLFGRPVAAMHPCFHARILGSDGRERVFLAGADSRTFGRGWFVLVLDADAEYLGDVPIDRADAPVTGVTATRDALLVTGRRGLLRFAVADVVPDGAGQLRAVLITPMLSAPDRDDRRRWLRIDATASLPEGSALEIAFASTDDPETRDRLNRIAGDTSMQESQRIEALRAEPDVWHAATEFHGSDAYAHGHADPFSAKLFDVTDRYLWVSVTLRAASGARLPQLSALDVRYPGRTLMQHLPAIYQREEEQPDSFLRSLVGVLEATTQGLDDRIGSMANQLGALTASDEWLDFVARWLGLPWDDGLTIDQKRRILMNAEALAQGRGTRAGLERLLESLLPGVPRRFRVTDATADVGFAAVGGGACPGSALPAMLGGGTRWTAELDSRAVLGYTRLPCPNDIDDGVGNLAGRIRIEIAATGAERNAWKPWLSALIAQMVPFSVRVDLRWVSQRAMQSGRLDGSVTLEGTPSTHLGSDAVTGVARLPNRGVRMSSSGPSITSPLN